MNNNENEIITAVFHNKRKDTPHKFATLTIDEAKALNYGDHVYFLTIWGTVSRAKVNGQPKTWVRNAGKCVVSLKYGLYEYFKAEYTDGKATKETMLKLVE